jgi:hypothetical protein
VNLQEALTRCATGNTDIIAVTQRARIGHLSAVVARDALGHLRALDALHSFAMARRVMAVDADVPYFEDVLMPHTYAACNDNRIRYLGVTRETGFIADDDRRRGSGRPPEAVDDIPDARDVGNERIANTWPHVAAATRGIGVAGLRV